MITPVSIDETIKKWGNCVSGMIDWKEWGKRLNFVQYKEDHTIKCPYCLLPLDDCECSDSDICQDIGDK